MCITYPNTHHTHTVCLQEKWWFIYFTTKLSYCWQLPCSLCSAAEPPTTHHHNVLVSLNETVLCHLPVFLLLHKIYCEIILEQPVFLDGDWSVLSWIKCQMPSFVAMCTYPDEKKPRWTMNGDDHHSNTHYTRLGLRLCLATYSTATGCKNPGKRWSGIFIPNPLLLEQVEICVCMFGAFKLLLVHQQSINEGMSYVLSKQLHSKSKGREWDKYTELQRAMDNENKATCKQI